MVVKALAGLHSAGVAHCALGPGTVLWYARDNAMKLAGLGCAAEPGQATRVSPALRYAPPEVRTLAAHTKGRAEGRACMAPGRLPSDELPGLQRHVSVSGDPVGV